MFYQIMVQFGDVEPFLRCNEDIAPATKAKLLSFFTDNEKKSKLKIELAIVIDYGKNFVKATYDLEGDGSLILRCFEIIDTLCIVFPSKGWIVIPPMSSLLLICPESL